VCVEVFLVGQQHEQAGVGEYGDLGGEGVVVAERDLVGGRRVVLVHDRDHVPGEQRLERRLGIDVRRPLPHVGGGQQYLRGSCFVSVDGAFLGVL